VSININSAGEEGIHIMYTEKETFLDDEFDI